MYLFNYNFFLKRKLGNCSGSWINIQLFFFFFNFFFLAVLGLHCCSWAFSSSVNGGYYLVEVRRLLIGMASLLSMGGFSNCGSPA